MARLTLYRNGHMVDALTLKRRKHLVGRGDDCDLLLNSPAASRHHIEVTWEDEGFVLRDLESENGTFIQGLREYGYKLTDKTIIQIADEMILFEPDDVLGGQDDTLTLPRWAIEEMDALPDRGEAVRRDQTLHEMPAMQRRFQAEGFGRARPHLVQMRAGVERVFPLDSKATTIGLGPAQVTIGPSESNQPEVRAVVERTSTHTYEIRARGLLARIEVNGEMVGRHRLSSGDLFEIGGVRFRFEMGLGE